MTKTNQNAGDRPGTTRRIRHIGLMIVAGAAALLLIIFVVKRISFANEASARKHNIAEGPRVRVVPVELSSSERKLRLNGEARPFESVTLYAKVSGYLKEVNVDKGDHVEEGQLLARIDASETNKDYEGAEADAKNKRAIADRLRPLLDKKLISQQEADAAFSEATMAEARLQSLGAVKGYQEIRAPFSGTITARYADRGALVQNAANSQTSALPLFTLSQTRQLRVYVYLDQKDASLIRKGIPVKIGVEERPEIQVDGKISRFSGELDPKTRMLLAEVDVDNRDGRLVAGSFVQVSFSVKSPPYLQVPVEALVQRQMKDCVPVVSSSNTVNYLPVTVADNDGDHVKVLNGLTAGQLVALNLGNSVEDGASVQPILPTPPAAPAPGK